MMMEPLVAGAVPDSMRIRDFWTLYGGDLEEDLPGALVSCTNISTELKVTMILDVGVTRV